MNYHEEYFDPDINKNAFSQMPPKYVTVMTIDLAFNCLEILFSEWIWILNMESDPNFPNDLIVGPDFFLFTTIG